MCYQGLQHLLEFVCLMKVFTLFSPLGLGLAPLRHPAMMGPINSLILLLAWGMLHERAYLSLVIIHFMRSKIAVPTAEIGLRGDTNSDGVRRRNVH
jgi:hypothetical protein